MDVSEMHYNNSERINTQTSLNTILLLLDFLNFNFWHQSVSVRKGQAGNPAAL